ncbi:PQQ-dependent sugar dehydrogenase [Candidatus Roizmanbacteria bacterium]|nr:PQQ-dependent sugar dehydrogenase [Candidatus Roizmanbacteria bacterium]
MRNLSIFLFLLLAILTIILFRNFLSPVIVKKPQPETELSNETKTDYHVEVFVQDLYVPWSMAFTSKDRMLVTERNGNIRVIENGVLNPSPLATFPEVSATVEEGLMGLAIDPDYEKNKYLYVCLAYPRGDKLVDKVVLLKDEGKKASVQKTIIDNIPSAQFHAGCRIKFGPDAKLYITTGDATERDLAQDKSSLAGKILRIEKDGSIPKDNPFPNSPIWSLGHRNPQGIAWQPDTNLLFETEHGPTGGDEINIIKKGKNYGWPIVSHERTKPEFVSPKLVFTPAVAPASALFYKSGKIPQFKNNFFFGGLRGEGVFRVVISDTNREKIVSNEKLKDIAVGRVRDIIEGPDGTIYFATSNRDGRGDPRRNDDKILRISPTR